MIPNTWGLGPLKNDFSQKNLNFFLKLWSYLKFQKGGRVPGAPTPKSATDHNKARVEGWKGGDGGEASWLCVAIALVLSGKAVEFSVHMLDPTQLM